MNIEHEEYELKLEALRVRLQEGEDSPIEEGFDFATFLDELHDQHRSLTSHNGHKWTLHPVKSDSF